MKDGVIRFFSMAVLLAVAALLSACATTGHYPADWSPVQQAARVGECPDISGLYANAGSSDTEGVRAPPLADLLVIDRAEQVEIRQTPDTLVALPRGAGATPAETIFRRASHIDRLSSRQFACLRNLFPDERRLYLSSQPSEVGAQGGGYAVLWFRSKLTDFQRAENGDLIVRIEEANVLMLAFIPVGKIRHVWFRYPAVR